MRLLASLAILALLATVAVADEAPDAEEFEVSSDGSVEAVEVDTKTVKGPYTVPEFEGKAILLESFQGEGVPSSWVKSGAADYAAQDWKVEAPKVVPGIEADKALTAKRAHQRYGISAPFDGPLSVGDDAFVLQYETRWNNGQECGGSYVKVLDETTTDFEDLNGETPYIIMFGPDRCGATDKVHFILRHQNPVSGEWEEKHMDDAPSTVTDTLSHLYTLAIRPDNSFVIMVDGEVAREGNLLEDMTPPINPPAEIDDPEDSKPADWVDLAKIDDPEAVKPEDWDEDAPATILDEDATMPEGWLEDEPELVADPQAAEPEDWDEDMDGEWEAPMIDNPKCEEAPGCGPWEQPQIPNPEYKGKWYAPKIDNPDYVGPWAPRKIANPNFFVDNNPAKLPKMSAVSIEILTNSADISFDNLLVTADEAAAVAFGQATWGVKHGIQAEVQDAERKRLERESRENAYNNGGLAEKLNYWVLYAVDLAEENIYAATALSLVLFVAICALCCCGSSEHESPIVEDDEDEDDETKEEIDTVEEDAAEEDADEGAGVGGVEPEGEDKAAEDAEEEDDDEEGDDAEEEGDEDEDEDEDEDAEESEEEESEEEEESSEEEDEAPGSAKAARRRRKKAD